MSIHEKIKPLNFTEEHKGKLISVSKRKYTWEFEHGDHTHLLVLEMSLLSRKVVVYFDAKFVSKGTRSLFRPFRYETKVHGMHVLIMEKLFSFDLYVNKQLFVKEKVNLVNDQEVAKFETGQKFPTLPVIEEIPKSETSKPRMRTTRSMHELENGDDDQDYLKVIDSPTSVINAEYRNIIDDVKSMKHRRKSGQQRNPFFLQRQSNLGEPMHHHQSSMPTQLIIDEFRLIGKESDRKNAGKANEQIFVVRKIKPVVLSQYEFGLEIYEKTGFSTVTPETKNLLKLLYHQ